MIDIRSERFIRFKDTENGKVSVVKAELDCDTAADLPAVDGLDGRELLMGSIAWDISTGDFYALGSDGSWYKQDGTGAYDPDAQVSLSAAPNLNIGNLNRPAVQPIQLVQPSFIGNIEGENVEDPTEEEPEVIEDEPEAEREVLEDAEPLRDTESR